MRNIEIFFLAFFHILCCICFAALFTVSTLSQGAAHNQYHVEKLVSAGICYFLFGCLIYAVLSYWKVLVFKKKCLLVCFLSNWFMDNNKCFLFKNYRLFIKWLFYLSSISKAYRSYIWRIMKLLVLPKWRIHWYSMHLSLVK